MAARHFWELEGIFAFGEPLKIFAIEIEREAGDPLPYSVIDFAIEDNVHLWTRLMEKFNGQGTAEFERLFLMSTEWNGLNAVARGKADQLAKPRLFSLLKRTPSYHGPILGIAVDKSPQNLHIVNRFRHGSPLAGPYRG
ncbi:hypothetical protein [Planctellipticum variicoloris]|jgi:hypothetical protein|uniref:hypothetical protein n=1 Tax=Planctellipticum variicoloris TaxID=3064265 RepID=UPI002B8C1A56|nr:hypothetical protein SH412_002124 [Planctomycetaceae bacterium SH412]HTN04740.1 hypothetical protein [Planctomycetaceae bacterium]